MDSGLREQCRGTWRAADRPRRALRPCLVRAALGARAEAWRLLSNAARGVRQSRHPVAGSRLLGAPGDWQAGRARAPAAAPARPSRTRPDWRRRLSAAAAAESERVTRRDSGTAQLF